MKTVIISERSKHKTLHVEAPGCIINIHTGLQNSDGQPVTNVSITASRYAGEPAWNVCVGDTNDNSGVGVRIIREEMENRT